MKTVGIIWVFAFFEAPIVIVLWYLTRSLSVRMREPDRWHMGKVLRNMLILILLMIALNVCVLILFVSPSILRGLPMAIKLTGGIILLVFYGCTAGAATGLAVGLRDAVRAGGSATKTVDILAGYVKDSINPGGAGNNPESKESEEKNRPQ